jgi:hypothetical protein
MEKNNSKEKLDNMIVIMVKTYPMNLTHAFTRVSEVTGYKFMTVQNRWYSHVRHRETIYTLKSEFVEIKNTRTMKFDLIDVLMKKFQVLKS